MIWKVLLPIFTLMMLASPVFFLLGGDYILAAISIALILTVGFFVNRQSKAFEEKQHREL